MKARSLYVLRDDDVGCVALLVCCMIGASYAMGMKARSLAYMVGVTHPCVMDMKARSLTHGEKSLSDI